MTKLLKILSLWITFYLLFSFIMWNLDPEAWPNDARGGMSLIAFFLTIVYLVTDTNNEAKK